MVKKLQYTLQDVKYAPFPVVTAPYGLALGGGCEICLASDRIVGCAELYTGLVEIGVGLPTNLRGTNAAEGQLAKARSLNGAILPDGTVHE